MLDVEDHKAVKRDDAKGEFIWVVTRSLSKIVAITGYLSICACGYRSELDVFSELDTF